MAFKGWPPEAITFYEGLEVDNSKDYWTAHKQVYEQSVRAPMEALLAEVESEFGAPKVFRPYRDVRFSADKSPYKTNCAAVCGTDDSVYYLSLSADGLFVGSGYYMLDKQQLDRYRRAVDGDASGSQLERVVKSLEKAGYDVGGHETLKSAPRGFSTDHPRIHLLRQKGLTMGKSYPPAKWLSTAKAKDRVVEVWRAAKPLNQWLVEHVGPSAERPER